MENNAVYKNFFFIVPFLIILVNDIYATIAYSVVPDNTNFLKYNG